MYNTIKKIDWEQYINVNATIRIDVTGQTKYFRNTKFIALKTKDAIVDKFKEKYRKRPNVDLKNPDLHIVLHFRDNKMNVLP